MKLKLSLPLCSDLAYIYISESCANNYSLRGKCYSWFHPWLAMFIITLTFCNGLSLAYSLLLTTPFTLPFYKTTSYHSVLFRNYFVCVVFLVILPCIIVLSIMAAAYNDSSCIHWNLYNDNLLLLLPREIVCTFYNYYSFVYFTFVVTTLYKDYSVACFRPYNDYSVEYCIFVVTTLYIDYSAACCIFCSHYSLLILLRRIMYFL